MTDFEKMVQTDKQAIQDAVDFYHQAFNLSAVILLDDVDEFKKTSDMIVKQGEMVDADADARIVYQILLYDEDLNIIKSTPEADEYVEFPFVGSYKGITIGVSYGMGHVYFEKYVKMNEGKGAYLRIIFDAQHIDRAVKLGNFSRWKTSEIVLATNGLSDYVHFIYPLNKDKSIRNLSKKDLDIPILYAIQGKERLLNDTLDYAGDHVVAAAAHVEHVEWGIVFKADASEVLQPIRMMWTVYTIVGITYAILAGVCSVVISNRLKDQRLEVEDSEAMFRGVFESTSIGMALVNMDGYFDKVNESFAFMLGYTVDEMVSKTIWEITHPDDLAISKKLFWDLINSKSEIQMQIQKRYVHKNGDVIHAVLGTAVLVDEEREPNGFVSQIVNITDVISLQKELVERESRLRTQFDYSAVGASILDLEGRWLEVNDALCNITGYTREELLATDFKSITHPDDLAVDMENVDKLISDKIQTYRMEKRYIHKDGHVVWILLVAAIVRDQNKNPLYFTAQIIDISDKKAWEHRLEESNKELSRFAYMASHDLKEPLRTVDSYIKLIKENYEDKEGTKTFFRHIFEANKRMENMIDGLLQYSKADASKLVYTEIQLDEVVRDHVLESLKDVIDEKDAHVACSDMNVEFEGDAIQIERLIQNLVSNSLKYSHPDRKPVVKIVGTESDDFVVIVVSDNGIGIPIKDQKDVFKMFYKSSNTGGKAGSGIGLAVCKKIARLHGGDICLESTEGSGSTFYVSIPKKRGENASTHS